MLMLAGIDDPKLLLALPPILLPRLTAYLAVSSVIPGTLRRRLWVVWFYGFSAYASFTSTVVIRWSAVGFGFGYGHNWISDMAPLSATAETRKSGFGRSLQVVSVDEVTSSDIILFGHIRTDTWLLGVTAAYYYFRQKALRSIVLVGWFVR